jgi:hypothetical protein
MIINKFNITNVVRAKKTSSGCDQFARGKQTRGISALRPVALQISLKGDDIREMVGLPE